MRREKLLTFVMTDVVGSVAFWEKNRAASSAAIALLEQITADLTNRYSGVLHKRRGEGDSFFITFENPIDAVHFAADWTQKLHHQRWPDSMDLACRVAIRTGTAEDRDGDYYGVTVNRCARMRALVGARQVILCDATYKLTRESLPFGAETIPISKVHLRDVEREESVFLLQVDGVPAKRTLESALSQVQHNMPPRLTSFVGREAERESIESAVRFHRLVTVIGPGGSGKTRITEEVAEGIADEFADGAWFIALAECKSEDDVCQAIFRAIRAHFDIGQSDWDSIISCLKLRHSLLVFDNCEHLLKIAAKAIHQILTSCARIRILATSRNPLGLTEEHTLIVGPFELIEVGAAPDLAKIASSPAVQLFLERASAKDSLLKLSESNSEAICKICRRLDGIALAIEQAASHAGRLSITQIADRLEKSFSLLKNPAEGTDPRHQTMIATIQWSVDILAEPAQKLFFALPVFAGSWNLDAAEFLGSATGLTSDEALEAHGELLDASLVQRFELGDVGIRYRMLETVREFALGNGAISDTVLQAQLDWCLQLARKADSELLGPNQAIWIRQLEWERGSIAQALSYADKTSVDTLVHLVEALKRYWVRSGLFQEGAHWMERALAIGASAEPRLRASILNALGACRWRLGESDVAEVHYQASLEIWEVIGDLNQSAAVLTNLAICATEKKNYDVADQYYGRSTKLFRDTGETHRLGSALINWGHLLTLSQNWEKSMEVLQEGIPILRRVEDKGHLAYALGNLSKVNWHLGYKEEYLRLSLEQLTFACESRDRGSIESILIGILNNAKEMSMTSVAQRSVEIIFQMSGDSPKFASTSMLERFTEVHQWLEELGIETNCKRAESENWTAIYDDVKRLLELVST